MTRAHPPPRGCIVNSLVAVDGDNWARWAFLQYPGLLAHARWQAEDCKSCAKALERLFPDGFPESDNIGGYSPEELERILDQLREDTGKNIDTP